MLEKLPEFLLNHPLLTGAFLGLSGALAWLTFKGGGRSGVTPAEATRLISHEDAVVVDIRADGEYRGGHVVGALNLTPEQLAAGHRKLEKYRGRPIIVACGTGQRAQSAVRTLREKNFERVYVLSGGMAAWRSANLPVTRAA